MRCRLVGRNPRRDYRARSTPQANSCRIIDVWLNWCLRYPRSPTADTAAECLTESIFTEGDTWDELRKNVLEATSAFFFDRPRPERVRLHLVRDEVLLVA